MGMGGWGLTNPNFSRIFVFVPLWKDPLFYYTFLTDIIMVIVLKLTVVYNFNDHDIV